MILKNAPINAQANSSVILKVKSSALCANKELFYFKNSDIITESEYKEALRKIENLDTIYFEMSQYEKNIYNKNIKIIKNYLSQTK